MSITGGRLATARRKGASAGADLPHALTFFLTSRQRARVVRTLSRIDPRRERALLLALRRPGEARARAGGRS